MQSNPNAQAIAAIAHPAPVFYHGNYVCVQAIPAPVANGERFPNLRFLQPLLETRHDGSTNFTKEPPKRPVLKPQPILFKFVCKQPPGGSAKSKKKAVPVPKPRRFNAAVPTFELLPSGLRFLFFASLGGG